MFFSRRVTTGLRVKEEEVDRLLVKANALFDVLQAQPKPIELKGAAPKQPAGEIRPAAEFPQSRERLASLEAVAMQLKASVDELSSKERESAAELAEARAVGERWAACAAERVSEADRLKHLLRAAEETARQAVERCSAMQAQHEREKQALATELSSRAETIASLTEERDREIGTLHRKLVETEKMISLLDSSLRKRRTESRPAAAPPLPPEAPVDRVSFEGRRRAVA